MQQTAGIKQNIVLSIALLASDRKDTIGRCLESLAEIREAVPSELIILDTGCSREVRDILEQYADKISDFTWCNDFSKARNVTLQMAEGEWYLYLDDDEWFSDAEELIGFFTSGEYKKYASASYIQRNYLDMQGSQYTDTRVGRMAKRTPQLAFQSKIHEYMAPICGENKNLCARVEHYGYVYDTEEKKRAHFERNRVLLEKMIEEEPLSLRWRLQLLQEYRTMDDYGQMDWLGQAGIAMIGSSDTEESCIYIGSFYAARILAADGRNDYGQVYRLCREAAADARNTKLCHAFLDEMLAKACFYQGLYADKPKLARETYLDSEQYAQGYLELQSYFEAHKEELYRQQIAPFVGECFDVVKCKEIYSIRICNGLKLNSTDNLEKYIDKLCWNEPHVYVFEEIAAILIEAMNKPDYEMKPEDERFHAFSRTIGIMHGQDALWEYFCGEIQSLERQGCDVQQLLQLIAATIPQEPCDEDEVLEKPAEMTPEMQQLVAQIKEQLQLLIRQGLTEQAGEVVAQLKTMVPCGTELDELEKQLEKGQ